MSLDISKITNAELKKLAYQHDKDNSLTLDKEEFGLFKEAALNKEGVSTDDFNQVMDLFGKTSVASTPAELKGNKPGRAVSDKEAQKNAKKFILREMDNLVNKACTREDVIDKLNAILKDEANEERYVEIKKAITDVMQLMPATYAEVKDIKNVQNHNEIIRKMSDNGINDDFHRDILRKLEKLAEVEVRQTAFDNIASRYGVIAGEASESEVKKSDEVIMKEIKSDLKAEKIYKREVKDAYKDYETTVIMPEATKKALNAIDKVEEGKTAAAVLNQAEEILVDEGEFDAYTKKALRKQKTGDAVTGYARQGRLAAQLKVVDIRVEDKKIQSEDEVLDALGCKKELYEAIIASGLATKNEDGTVDLTELSEVIRLQVGADNTLNCNARVDKTISEKYRTTSKLAKELELNDLTEAEAKKLVKLCGYKIDNNAKGFLLGALGGAGLGAVAGGAAAVLTPRQAVAINGGTLNHNLNINLNGNVDQNIVDQLQANGATITKTATGITVTISQMIELGNTLFLMPKLVGPMVWPAVAVGAALGALKGLEGKAEIPIIPTSFSEKTFDEYIERTTLELERNNSKGYAEVITCLASSFIREDGSWDYEGYKNLLNNIAGDGSKLNRQELIRGCEKLLEIGGKDPEAHTYSEHETQAVAPQFEEVPVIDGSRTSWAQISRQYDCLIDRYQLSGAIRLVKLAQAIEDGDYSTERMEKLYELSKKGRTYLQNIDGFNYEKYCRAIDATYLSKLEKDAEGNNIPGTGVKVPNVLAECERNAELSLEVERMAKALKVVHPLGHAYDRIRISDGVAAKYYARFDNGPALDFDNKADRDKKVAEFKKRFPNATVTKWED